jgi:hypothetical protein
MITLAELHPDKALEALLKGNVSIAISASESRIAEVYRQGERPNTDLGDEFIDILPNGVVQAMTKPLGVYRGNLAVTLYCKAQSDGTVKFNRINSMLSQVESLVNCKSSGKFFFKITPSNVITPMTYNSATGYTTITINIEWNTTE